MDNLFNFIIILGIFIMLFYYQEQIIDFLKSVKITIKKPKKKIQNRNPINQKIIEEHDIIDNMELQIESDNSNLFSNLSEIPLNTDFTISE